MRVQKLVFWDIDGTLLYCGSDGKHALEKTFQELYSVANAFGAAPIGTTSDATLLDTIMHAFGIDPKELSRIHDRYEENLKRILAADRKKRILPGVSALVDAIATSEGAMNAILTSNLKIGADAKLSSLGLETRFRHGGYGDFPEEKWDAAKRCMVQIEEEFQVRIETDRIWLIGDSTYDIECAKRLGISVIAVASGFASFEELKRCDPDYLFHDLSDTGVIRSILEL